MKRTMPKIAISHVIDKDFEGNHITWICSTSATEAEFLLI